MVETATANIFHQISFFMHVLKKCPFCPNLAKIRVHIRVNSIILVESMISVRQSISQQSQGLDWPWNYFSFARKEIFSLVTPRPFFNYPLVHMQNSLFLSSIYFNNIALRFSILFQYTCKFIYFFNL